LEEYDPKQGKLLDEEPQRLRHGYFHQKYYRAIHDKTKQKNMLNMFDLLEALEGKVDGEIKPDGSRSFPARSCRDIQMCFPEAETDDYWLDPNEGSKSDAILVHCNFTGTVETCIKPTTVFDIKEFNTVENDQFNWIGQEVEREASEVLYAPSNTQWKNLRMAHNTVRQNVTYACKNSPANIKLLSYNNEELHANSIHRHNRLDIIKDECLVNDGQWRNAIFEFSTTKLNRLPIRDIAVAGARSGDQYFSIKLGSVCFS